MKNTTNNKNIKACEVLNMEQTINTIYGKGVYSHSVNDTELDKNDYSFSNGYAVIHKGNNHDIYKIVEGC